MDIVILCLLGGITVCALIGIVLVLKVVADDSDALRKENLKRNAPERYKEIWGDDEEPRIEDIPIAPCDGWPSE